MIATAFASAEAAERAFYSAFERADLAAMMAVWAEDEEIICVHPGGPRLCGVAEVRESWRQLFAQGPQLSFSLSNGRLYPGRMLAVHSVFEHVKTRGDPRPATAVLATNVYVLTPRGWRMLMHHASVPPAAPPAEEPPPSMLH